MRRKIIGVTVGTPMNPQKVVEKTDLAERVDRLSEEKADKNHVDSMFEELKQMILNSGAVAVLDQAILDLSTLA